MTSKLGCGQRLRGSVIFVSAALTLGACAGPTAQESTMQPEVSVDPVTNLEFEDREFATSGYVIRDPRTISSPYWSRPYWYGADDVPAVIPLEDQVEGKYTDPEGVLLVEWPGYEEPIVHPVNQAMYGIYSMMAYEHTGDPVYLQRAEANARFLLSHSEGVDGAVWFPYMFPYNLHGDESMALQPNWYSGMAQGQMLSLLSQLCGATSEAEWCEAADATFQSFLQPDLPGQSFVRIDGDGHLWLEEYVGDGVEATSVINGHIYSAFGLVDYYLLTGSEDALVLFDGAATTIRDSFPEYRVPGEASFYCIGQYCKNTDWQSESYHSGVARQIRQLGAITGDKSFRELFQLLDEDREVFEAQNPGS